MDLFYPEVLLFVKKQNSPFISSNYSSHAFLVISWSSPCKSGFAFRSLFSVIILTSSVATATSFCSVSGITVCKFWLRLTLKYRCICWVIVSLLFVILSCWWCFILITNNNNVQMQTLKWCQMLFQNCFNVRKQKLNYK